MSSLWKKLAQYQPARLARVIRLAAKVETVSLAKGIIAVNVKLPIAMSIGIRISK